MSPGSGTGTPAPEETLAAMPGRRRKPDAPHALQLPSGRHGLERHVVAQQQRDRILAAVTEVMATHGFLASAVERIASAAGVSRRTFYEQFSGKEAAFLAAYEQASGRLLLAIDEADDPDASLDDRLHSALAAVLDELVRDPSGTRFLVVEVLSAGPSALAVRDAQMTEFARRLTALSLAHHGRPLPPLAAEGLVGGLYDLVYKRVAADQVVEIAEILDDLHRFALLFFQVFPDPRAEEAR